MAVLVEALSVIVRRDAVESRFNGGWSGFLSVIPNNTFCTDGLLARVGFMTPDDVEAFIQSLEEGGLSIANRDGWLDVAVVDQMRGPTAAADWLQFARLNHGGTDQKVGACWLLSGPKLRHGAHVPALQMSLATPIGWVYETSLSANTRFVPTEEITDKLQFVRHEDGSDVYFDRSTGQELFVGRAKT